MHLAIINHLNAELTAARVHKTNLQLTTVLYKLMDGQSEFEGLIQSLSTAHALTPLRMQTAVTYQFVTNQLHERYHVITNSQITTPKKNEIALWMNGNSDKSNNKKDKIYQNCRKKGHFIKDCYC